MMNPEDLENLVVDLSNRIEELEDEVGNNTLRINDLISRAQQTTTVVQIDNKSMIETIKLMQEEFDGPTT